MPSEALVDEGEPNLDRAPDEDFAAAFVASMPERYRLSFDPSAIAAHTAIVQRRGASSTHVEIWKELAERVVAICVVADDRPGLLSQISAALVAHEVDVIGAHAYCRPRDDGSIEAVDLLWIRRISTSAPRLRARDVMRMAETLDALVRGDATFDNAVSFARAIRAASSSTRLRFEEDSDGVTLLSVEAVDRPGLLLAVTRALFRAQVQILGVHVCTEDGRALDRFQLAELDGARLRRSRLLELQTVVLAAIDER
jgi:[protein-PII] uridylyltransferase